MFGGRLVVAVVALVGMAGSLGCASQQFGCAGLCNSGDGSFSGVIDADGLVDAKLQCLQKMACTTPDNDCGCYLLY
jgi:hypothetical protein